MYDKMPAKSHLKGLLPERKGPRPGIGKWPVPHRQVDGFASKEMNETMQTHLVTLSESNLSHLSIQTSAYERRGPALWICQDPDGKTGNSDQPEKRELAHVHDSEGSSHVILSPKDAKEVIEKRWGERHGLSGVMVVPAGYLMIYGPKNEEELKAWKMIIAASVAYGGGGAGRGIEL
ncbi:hypothetical protein MMC25_005909 [Agyrium rufum]|nr:hypothetical protein [Agyrium rufum]